MKKNILLLATILFISAFAGKTFAQGYDGLIADPKAENSMPADDNSAAITADTPDQDTATDTSGETATTDTGSSEQSAPAAPDPNYKPDVSGEVVLQNPSVDPEELSAFMNGLRAQALEDGKKATAQELKDSKAEQEAKIAEKNAELLEKQRVDIETAVKAEIDKNREEQERLQQQR